MSNRKDLNMKFLILLIFTVLLDNCYAESEPVETRNGKVLPVFQVVRFPNDPCVISGGTKNGTCYTTEECSNKGGTNGGSCASGFGVCCTFTLGCGASSSENCTYFEVATAPTGPCTAEICKINSNICQMRLDFTNFVITGPSTVTVSNALMTAGVVGSAGKAVSSRGNCQTDAFTVSGGTIVPELCGTLTGDHLYFDTTQDCHDLAFSIGQAGNGATAATTRSFNIKVTQIACNSVGRAPDGCLQYITDTTSTGIIKTFNFDQGVHLANQFQQICFRREAGNCRICYSADAVGDVNLGGKATKVVTKGELGCCGYGAKGTKSTGAYDCLFIPGAEAVNNGAMAADCQAGGLKGLAVVTGTTAATVCSAQQPFRIAFKSDAFEYTAAGAIADPASHGFKLRYWQMTC